MAAAARSRLRWDVESAERPREVEHPLPPPPRRASRPLSPPDRPGSARAAAGRARVRQGEGGEWDAYDAHTGTPEGNGQQFEYDWAVEDSAATEAAIASGNGPREFDGFPTVDEIKAEDAYSDIFDDSDEDLVSDDE